MMHIPYRPTPLSLAALPGPDTVTKRAALEVTDRRLRLMLQESAQVGWPAAYTDDLYRHDVEILTNHPEESMLWILRENGTHLYPLKCDNTHEAAYYRQVIRYLSGDHQLNLADGESDRARYYIVSEERLMRVTADEAQGNFVLRAK